MAESETAVQPIPSSTPSAVPPAAETSSKTATAEAPLTKTSTEEPHKSITGYPDDNTVQIGYDNSQPPSAWPPNIAISGTLDSQQVTALISSLSHLIKRMCVPDAQ